MQNVYGDRRVVAVRVAAAEIVESVVSGTALPPAKVSGGVPATATLVDMRVYADGPETPAAGVILVFEDASFGLVNASSQIPEVTASAVLVNQPVPETRAVEDLVQAAEEVTAEQAPETPAEPAAE